jgi:hypothetical protein
MKRGFCFISGVDRKRRILLAHQHQAERMIEIGVGQESAGDRAVPEWNRAGLNFRRALNLPGQVGRRIDQEPAIVASGNRDA